MLPGAGFPAEMIDRLNLFHSERFGIRVQHILNDRVRISAFKHANKMFQPHVVISNNRHWSLDDLSMFAASARYVLEGAVDVDGLAAAQRPRFFERDSVVIGGLANKNPAPLLQLLRQMADVKLKLFGRLDSLPSGLEDLVEHKRLELLGALNEEGLRAFYADVDIVVHTDKYAGWANLAAEALAAGVPLICTRHGTLAFAEHERTALVVDEPTPAALVDAVGRLRSTPKLARRLAEAGSKRVRPYSWTSYASALLELTFAATMQRSDVRPLDA
jgi:glycosyltransferase involved in cell wall biosynthesis